MCLVGRRADRWVLPSTATCLWKDPSLCCKTGARQPALAPDQLMMLQPSSSLSFPALTAAQSPSVISGEEEGSWSMKFSECSQQLQVAGEVMRGVGLRKVVPKEPRSPELLGAVVFD